jgi:hypothetical protein
VTRAIIDAEPAALAEQLAGLLEADRPSRIRAGHARVDRYEVGRLVKQINTATGTSSHRDWRGRVKVSPASPVAAAANAARDAVEHGRRLPLTDDALVPADRLRDLAASLRQVTE